MGQAKDILARGGRKAMFLPKEVAVRAGLDTQEEMSLEDAQAKLEKILRGAFDMGNPRDAEKVVEAIAALKETFNLSDPAAFGMAEKAANRIANSRKAMSPPGSLGLPEALEARRWEYSIPDGAFKIQPFHDRIFLFQKEWVDAPAVTDGGILLTQQGLRREQESAPEGIIVAAGLKALDEIRSNGIDLGHHISFIRQAPWRMVVSNVEGREKHVVLLRSGDITGSYTLAEEVRTGKTKVEFDEKSYEHYYVNGAGEQWRPAAVSPTINMPEDY